MRKVCIERVAQFLSQGKSLGVAEFSVREHSELGSPMRATMPRSPTEAANRLATCLSMASPT
jgi:hypothetical protein